MFNIVLKNLDRQTIYPEVLKMSEYVCDEYQLYSQFGIISMANQAVVDYLLDLNEDFKVNMEVNIESREISVSFDSELPVFEGFNYRPKETDPLTLLTDKFILSSDNKSVTFMFHVKPRMKMCTTFPAKVFKSIKNKI